MMHDLQVTTGQNENNWPQLPRCFHVKPCLRQDFELDFQDQQRSLVIRAYYSWLLHVCAWLMNVFVTLAFAIACPGVLKFDAGFMFGGSIIFLIIMTPMSLIFWYRSLYNALKSDMSLKYLVFFFNSVMIITIDILQCLGIHRIPSCGWLNGLAMLGYDNTAAGIMLFDALIFTLLAGIDSLLLFVIYRFYRANGGSIEKAKQEFSHGAHYLFCSVV